MQSERGVLGLFLISVSVLAACGGGSSPSPAQPAPVPYATPVPQPTPPPLALSQIPPCSLASSKPTHPDCTKPPQTLKAAVDEAINRTMSARPELFDFHDVDGGPRILDYKAYMIAVVAALGEQAGMCGNVDAEGEIGVKKGNSYSEQWIIASKAGWNPPAGNWVQRKYVGACSPATF